MLILADAQPAAGVTRNLAVRFTADTIDDTPLLARTLQQGAALGSALDLTQLDLPGDHLRPLRCVMMSGELHLPHCGCHHHAHASACQQDALLQGCLTHLAQAHSSSSKTPADSSAALTCKFGLRRVHAHSVLALICTFACRQELPPEVASVASAAAQQGRPLLDQLSAFARSAGVQGLDEVRVKSAQAQLRQQCESACSTSVKCCCKQTRLHKAAYAACLALH